MAATVAVFWACLVVWGHADPDTGAADTAKAITVPVLMLLAGAFGIDSFYKQGRGT